MSSFIAQRLEIVREKMTLLQQLIETGTSPEAVLAKLSRIEDDLMEKLEHDNTRATEQEMEGK